MPRKRLRTALHSQRRRRGPQGSLLLLCVLLVFGGLLPACGPVGRPLPTVAADAPLLAAPASAFSVLVLRVVDGDTVVVRPGSGAAVRVRLVGVDTPESVKPGTPVACFGHEASAFTLRLLRGQRLRAAYERERQDAFGRELLDLWLSDGRWVQGLLVASGVARAYPYRPNTLHAAALAEAERRARSGSRGLWRACSPTSAFPQLARTAPP